MPRDSCPAGLEDNPLPPSYGGPVTATLEGPGILWVMLPVKLVSEANAHTHWRFRHNRAKAMRGLAKTYVTYDLSGSHMVKRKVKPRLPCVVTITRIAPRNLDSDNLAGSAKHVRDGIADALGIDDRDPRVTWVVEQRRGLVKEYACAVRIEWTP